MPLLAIPFPAIDPVLIRFGPFAIRWYALAYIVGLVLGWQYLRWLVQRPGWKITPEQLDDFLVYATLGIVLGGRIGYILFYRPDFYSQPTRSRSSRSGRAACRSTAACSGSSRPASCSPASAGCRSSRSATRSPAPAPIGLFLGRLANFINGELWGRVSDVPWAMVFPGGGPLPRHPSQLYEAGLEGMLLFVVMTVLALRPRPPGSEGRLGGAFLIGYGIARSIGELFREPDVQLGFLAGGLTMGQLLSLPMIAGRPGAGRLELPRRAALEP